MAIKSALGRQFGTQFDSVFDVAKSNPIYDKAGGRIPSLDLNFARSESLRDSRSTKNKITFTRASSGTFVGADGLIKTTPVNLLTYSERFDDDAWFKANSTTITPNTIAAPDGSITAETFNRNSTSTGNYIDSRLIPKNAAPEAYTWSLFVKKNDARYASLRLQGNFPSKADAIFDLDTGTVVSANTSSNFSNATASIQASGNGWFRVSLTATSDSREFIKALFGCSAEANQIDGTSSVANSAYIWGAQLEEGLVMNDYIPTTGTISGAPRFDHNPSTGESLGLLIEEARTNEISNDITVTSPTTGVTLSEDTAVTNPDGTTGAIKMTADAGSTVHTTQRNSNVTTTNHTFSIFVKKGNHRYIGLSQGGTSNNIHVVFDTDTKTITDDGSKNNGTFVSSGFEEYANGWFRIHVVGFTQGTVLRVFLAQNAEQNGLRTWNATGNEFAYVWGMQREDGTFPTSYIPTSGSTVTRAADVVEITGTNLSSFYNQSEGTVFVEALNYPHPITGRALVPFAYSDNSFNNRVNLASSTGNDQFNFDVTGGGSQQRAILGNFVSTGLKASGGYKVTGSAGSLDGATAVTSSTPNIPSSIDRLDIGNAHNGQEPLNGHIKRFTYFNTRLSDDKLKSITT